MIPGLFSDRPITNRPSQLISIGAKLDIELHISHGYQDHMWVG